MKKALLKKLFLKRKRKKRAGFTLIELLIVIAIVGILSTFLTTNVIDVQQKARDEKRKTDIAQLQSVLEQYHNDNGSYPISASGNLQLNNTPCQQSFDFNSIIYLKSIPCDPLGTASNFNSGNYYYYSSDGQSYTVATCLERKTDPDGQAQLQ